MSSAGSASEQDATWVLWIDLVSTSSIKHKDQHIMLCVKELLLKKPLSFPGRDTAAHAVVWEVGSYRQIVFMIMFYHKTGTSIYNGDLYALLKLGWPEMVSGKKDRIFLWCPKPISLLFVGSVTFCLLSLLN